MTVIIVLLIVALVAAAGFGAYAFVTRSDPKGALGSTAQGNDSTDVGKSVLFGALGGALTGAGGALSGAV